MYLIWLALPPDAGNIVPRAEFKFFQNETQNSNIFVGVAATVRNEKTQQIRVHHGRVKRRHDHCDFHYIDYGIRRFLAVWRRRQRQSHAQPSTHSNV